MNILKFKITLMIALNSFYLFFLSAMKGDSPESSSYISIPRHHQSTALLWPFYFRNSGARYSVVPQNV